MIPLAIPAGRPLRVVGDVHGDLRAFSAAVQTDRFIVLLGDLADHGPDSAGVLRTAFRLIGVSISELSAGAEADPPDLERRHARLDAIETAVADLRARFGRDSVDRAFARRPRDDGR